MRETGFLFLLLQTAEGARDKYLRIASSIAAAAAANDVLAKKPPPSSSWSFYAVGMEEVKFSLTGFLSIRCGPEIREREEGEGRRQV